jgi:uncharacterized Fe-S cluster protein YjdI
MFDIINIDVAKVMSDWIGLMWACASSSWRKYFVKRSEDVADSCEVGALSYTKLRSSVVDSVLLVDACMWSPTTLSGDASVFLSRFSGVVPATVQLPHTRENLNRFADYTRIK